MQPLLCRIDEAACALSVSRSAVYRLVQAGELERREVRFGGPRITVESVLRVAAASGVKPAKVLALVSRRA